MNIDYTAPESQQPGEISALAERDLQKNAGKLADPPQGAAEILEAAPCPVCATPATAKHADTPYWTCPKCDCWFQWPQPPKVFEGEHEPAGDSMSDDEKAVNEWLAGWLVNQVMGGRIGESLDIGAKYPYLASRLKARGYSAVAIDGIGEIGRFGEALDVPVIRGDFERMPIQAPETWKRDLITLVHCFEHFYDPLGAMRRIRARVRDNGRVLIRLPDHSVKGFERDLKPSHYVIHPFYHSFSSILEILAQLGHAFVVEQDVAHEGIGQRDIILRPVTSAPKVHVGMIVKNEARDLPKCLDSLKGAADGIYLIDTGSTDGTLAIAGQHELVRQARTYTEASKQDDKGDWKLQSFAQARNQFVADVEASDADWLLWLDADDQLLTPHVIRRAKYDFSHDVYGMWIQSSGSTWVTYRMWKTGRGIVFKGRCHEYPVLGDNAAGMLAGALILHDPAPTSGEDSNVRNLRILLAEWEEERTPRGAFYIANTHKDAGRWLDAVTWYNRRIEFGEGFRDEWLFSWLYRARAERHAGQLDSAEATLLVARELAPDWMEFTTELAQVEYERAAYQKCIDIASQAVAKPIPPSLLWRESDKYGDQPLRLISWCYEHQGKLSQALKFGEMAAKAIGHPDQEWDDRLARLRNTCGPFIASRKQAAIALHRPGAIGDILMTLNLIPALREANPGLQIHYFCHHALGRPEALGGIMRAAGVDLILDSGAFPHWSKSYERTVNLVGYPLEEGYPEKPMRKHLLQYFAAEMGLDVGDGLPALTLPRPERPASARLGDYVTYQERAGWSKYKEWPHWPKVREKFWPDIDFIRIDESEARTLAESIALVANARMHVGIDSFVNHLTNYFWTDQHGGRRVPGVILWGSTQASAAGYPDNINISLGLDCQPCFRENPAISQAPRGPCINPLRPSYDDATPHACMDGISVERVVEAVRQMWEQVTVPA